MRKSILAAIDSLCEDVSSKRTANITESVNQIIVLAIGGLLIPEDEEKAVEPVEDPTIRAGE